MFIFGIMHLKSDKPVHRNYKLHFTDNIAVVSEGDKAYIVSLVINTCCLFNKSTDSLSRKHSFIQQTFMKLLLFMDLKMVLPLLFKTFSLVRKTIKQTNQY